MATEFAICRLLGTMLQLDPITVKPARALKMDPQAFARFRLEIEKAVAEHRRSIRQMELPIGSESQQALERLEKGTYGILPPWVIDPQAEITLEEADTLIKLLHKVAGSSEL